MGDKTVDVAVQTTFKSVITKCCEEYAKDPQARFIGYNTAFGSRMYGTLSNVPSERCIETPVAENLMMGLAMGMTFEGFRPVVCFERHDFLLLALDAIVNHMDKLPWLSGDKYSFPIIIRAIVGASHPLNPGPQHTGNYTHELSRMLSHTIVREPATSHEYELVWNQYTKGGYNGPIIIIEHRDHYEQVSLPTRGDIANNTLGAFQEG